MNFTLACPSCQRSLRVPENLLGQSVKCPSCGHIFTAPDRVEEEAPRQSTAEQPSRRATPQPVDAFDDAPRRPPDDDYDEDHDEVPRRRGRGPKPGKVQAIAVMILVGGIFACVWSLGWTMLSGFGCCLWPGSYYGLVTGIMAITKGANLLNDNAYRLRAPQGIAIMMIINIINGDLVNLTLGILVLVFLADREVREFFRV